MTALASAVVPSIKPRLQTAWSRVMYSTLSLMLKEDSKFLNYGYAPIDSSGAELELDTKDKSEQVSAQLYFRVAGAIDLHGKDVLEIGCGRGGGAAFVAKYLHPASMTGVDLSDRAVQHCRQNHRDKVLTFIRGEARNLPFPADSFDAVLNVESSHSYPSFEGFVSEVARVLRPEGVFLFADFRLAGAIALLREQVQQQFTILEEEFITGNVVRALEIDSERRRVLIQKRFPKFLQDSVQAFAGIEGTFMFNAFASGDLQYVRFVLQKRS